MPVLICWRVTVTVWPGIHRGALRAPVENTFHHAGAPEEFIPHTSPAELGLKWRIHKQVVEDYIFADAFQVRRIDFVIERIGWHWTPS